MASVGGPKFFSNNMHTQIFSTHGKSPLLQTGRTCIATHMIFSKMMICWWRSPVSQWLSHNKQLIRTKIHKWHIPYHNSFLGYFPMSYYIKQVVRFWRFLKVAHKQIALEWRKIPHIGRYGGHKWHEVFGLGIWKHEKHSLSVQVFG